MSAKRKQPSEDAEPNAAAVYVVTVTEFTDDYKARYGDWANVESVRVFTTRAGAEQYKLGVMKEHVEVWQDDRATAAGADGSEQSSEDASIGTLFDRCNRAEYVDRHYAIELWERTVDHADP